MKTQYYTACSIDGFIADRNNSLDWLMQFGSPEETSYPDFIRDVGALAMGATTYEWVLQHMEENEGEQWSYEQPAWIFTHRTLPPVPEADIRFVSGDVRAPHREMVAAAAGKNVWIVGGGDLAGQFYDAGLLDEIIIQFAPVTLGGGAPVFPRAVTRPPLQLQSVQTFGGTFTEVRYRIDRSIADAD